MRTRSLSLLLQPGSSWLAVPSSHPSCLVGLLCHFLECCALQLRPSLWFSQSCPHLRCLLLPSGHADPCFQLLSWHFGLTLLWGKVQSLSPERSRVEQQQRCLQAVLCPWLQPLTMGEAGGTLLSLYEFSANSSSWELRLDLTGTVLSTLQGRFLPTLALSTVIGKEGSICLCPQYSY